MQNYGIFEADQVPMSTREKIEKAGGECYQLTCDGIPVYIDGRESPIWLYLPDETDTTEFGYLLPGNVPLYVESHYEMRAFLQGTERVIVLSLR